MRTAAIIVIYLCLLAVCSCGSDSKTHALLEEIDRICDSVPEEAIGILDTIDQSGLSEKDLNRLRLLWIKSRDKAYIAHTSDTLILDVVDYYSSHRSEGLYPEALYYGGRVYSDLGDLPTALEFFQKSLDEIPEDDAHLRFKATVLDQTGRLLHTLRLDSAAIEYLEKSLEIDSRSNNNNYRMAYTHSYICDSYLGQKNLAKASTHINEAIRLSSDIPIKNRLALKSKLAEIYLWKGNLDSALQVVRPLQEEVDSIDYSVCLAIATQIYKEAGILDTACIYARNLTRLHELNGKKTGYTVLFSDKLRGHVDKDTLLKLMPEYKRVVEDYLNSHKAEQALIQNARYNYSRHVRKREETEVELKSLKERLWIGVGGFTIILLITASIILWHKYHKTKNDAQIMEGLILTDKLKEQSLQCAEDNFANKNSFNASHDFMHEKRRILDDIKKATEMNPENSVDSTLKASPLYKDLKEKAENKRVMGKDVTWRMIEDLVESVSLGFDNRLDVLTNSKITTSERYVAYLLKFGFTQTQIASLLAKDTSTISAHRTSLAKKIGYDKSVIAAIIVRL